MTEYTEAPRMRFGHVGLMVKDFDRMKDFYVRVLGFTSTDEGPAGPCTMVFLCTEPRDHHQIFLCSGRGEGEAGSRIHHFAFRMDSIADLRKISERLAGEVPHIEPANHGIAWSLYTADPEGNQLEFFVETPWFIHQPMKQPLDFTLTDDEIVRTTEAFCRTQPGFQPHPEWYRKLAGRMREGAAHG
jgi:catechol-2,3-dioxygenase